MSDNQEKLTEKDFKDPYEYGFETEIDSDFAPKGLNEEIVKFISNKKNEPKWLPKTMENMFQNQCPEKLVKTTKSH